MLHLKYSINRRYTVLQTRKETEGKIGKKIMYILIGITMVWYNIKPNSW